MNNREKLIDLMIEHDLERREIAEMVHVKKDQVDRWLRSPEVGGHEEVPEMAVELLELKLASRAEKSA